LSPLQPAAGPIAAVSNDGSDMALEARPPAAMCKGGWWRIRQRIGRLTAQPPFDRAAGRTTHSTGGCEGLQPFYMAVGPPTPYKMQQHPGGDRQEP
jgi:hypothetical protein